MHSIVCVYTRVDRVERYETHRSRGVHGTVTLRHMGAATSTSRNTQFRLLGCVRVCVSCPFVDFVKYRVCVFCPFISCVCGSFPRNYRSSMWYDVRKKRTSMQFRRDQLTECSNRDKCWHGTSPYSLAAPVRSDVSAAAGHRTPPSHRQRYASLLGWQVAHWEGLLDWGAAS